MTGTQSRRTCTVRLFTWQHANPKTAFGGVADAPEWDSNLSRSLANLSTTFCEGGHGLDERGGRALTSGAQHAMGCPWLVSGFCVHSSSARSCGSGFLLVVLPLVSSVVVLPTPAWLLPGPSNVVQVTVPRTRSQFSGSGSADADIANMLSASSIAASTLVTLRMM
jgi:hypothetical protein